MNIPQFTTLAINDIEEFFEKALFRLKLNVTRIQSLLSLYKIIIKYKEFTYEVDGATEDDIGLTLEIDVEDILRAAIVLLHATMEDSLREIARTLMPFNENFLNRIPLVNQTGNLHVEKFKLKDLVSFREKTVDEVIKMSVNQYMDRWSLSTIENITQFIQDVGLSVEDFKHLFPKLSALIKRRHIIVHQADTVGEDNNGVTILQDIEVSEFEEWLHNVVLFIGEIIMSIYMRYSLESDDIDLVINKIVKLFGCKTFEECVELVNSQEISSEHSANQ